MPHILRNRPNCGTNYSGAMIEAGSETTSMQLNNMLIGILSNPEVIVRAHEELDRVVGNKRPPNFNDEPKLKYIRAIVKVVLSVNILISGSHAMASNQ